MNPRVEAVGGTTSLAERKRYAGQRVMIGFGGPAVDDDLRRLVRELKPCGFVLFARNIVEPGQVRDLLRELGSLVEKAHPALFAVDQEGGRVQRLKAPATLWPPMRAVGRVADRKKDGAATLTAEVARAVATELRAVGFNLDFAPVADVDSNPKNPIIGDRAFAADAEDVAWHVAAFVKAMQDEGVVACAKHFPGHGDTSVDSHLDLPVVEKDLPELQHTELVPFRAAVEAGVGSVMSAHVVFPAWDEQYPATLSPRILPGLLRAPPAAPKPGRRNQPREGGLGFDGVVFSDDLEMKAVAGRWSIDDQVRLATGATIDVMLCCKEPGLQAAMFESLVRAQELDPNVFQASRTSAKRVQALRERFFLTPRAPVSLDVLGCSAHQALAERLRERSGIA